MRQIHHPAVPSYDGVAHSITLNQYLTLNVAATPLSHRMHLYFDQDGNPVHPHYQQPAQHALGHTVTHQKRKRQRQQQQQQQQEQEPEQEQEQQPTTAKRRKTHSGVTGVLSTAIAQSSSSSSASSSSSSDSSSNSSSDSGIEATKNTSPAGAASNSPFLTALAAYLRVVFADMLNEDGLEKGFRRAMEDPNMLRFAQLVDGAQSRESQQPSGLQQHSSGHGQHQRTAPQPQQQHSEEEAVGDGHNPAPTAGGDPANASARHGLRWTPEEDEQLLQLVARHEASTSKIELMPIATALRECTSCNVM